jgi:2-methylaconitate cis-trans-isomerase PrpF
MMELSLSSDQTNIASLLAGAGPLSVEEDLLAKYGSTAQVNVYYSNK